MSREEMPLKCEECSKSFAVRYHRKCDSCQKIEFEESVFCDLNRSVQDLKNFECHSFEPKLEIVDLEKTSSQKRSLPVQQSREISYSELLNSDKIKYERALALQRLKRDPDAIYIQLKYHLTWNVVRRMPVFKDNRDFIETAISLFPESSLVVDDFVHLIFLAPDHVHLLVESNGELSVEEIINRIKDFTCKRLFEKYPFLKDKIANNSIWDDAYFVETLG
ncbi:IS200/IS605 family transposase [Thermodesulfobacteriota bacterium]